MHNSPPRRSVRSFVLRQGRVSNAQSRAYEALLPVYGLPFQDHPLDFVASFGRKAPTILEIGFGMGESTATIAATNPTLNYLAVEVHTPGVGSLLKQIDEQGLKNIRVVQHDAVEVLDYMIKPGSLAGVHIFFPDPWPKKRHHKRRLIQAPFVQRIAACLANDAYLHAATDWEDYAVQILSVLSAEPLLQNAADQFSPRPANRPQTKFESRGLGLGHGVWDIVFRRI